MFLRFREKINRKRAFTIVELMITCIIIGVLLSLAIPSFMTSRLRADEQKAMATLYAYAQGQKAYWFDQPSTGNTYTDTFSDLVPSYVDVPQSDGDWNYSIEGDANTFTVTANHLNVFGAPDGLSLVLHENGQLERLGSWPYTVYETP